MIRSARLRPAEALLLQITEEELGRKVEEANEEAERRLKTLLRSLDLDESTKGAFRRDPFDKTVAFFVYDDGTTAAEEPEQ